eukprot:468952-Amphidinium_carterae.1
MQSYLLEGGDNSPSIDSYMLLDLLTPERTRTGVALFDQSYFGKFFLHGPDAEEAVQYICGADMQGKQPWSVTYTPLLNADGGVEAIRGEPDRRHEKLRNSKFQ